MKTKRMKTLFSKLKNYSNEKENALTDEEVDELTSLLAKGNSDDSLDLLMKHLPKSLGKSQKEALLDNFTSDLNAYVKEVQLSKETDAHAKTAIQQKAKDDTYHLLEKWTSSQPLTDFELETLYASMSYLCEQTTVESLSYVKERIALEMKERSLL